MSTWKLSRVLRSIAFKGNSSRRRKFAFELLESRRLLAGNNPPNVTSITRLSANPSNASQVSFRVLFDEAVTGVNLADFTLTTSGLASTSLASVTGSGDTYTVIANTGTGSGTLRLNLIDNDSIRDLSNDRLGGNGPNNGNFTSGEVYTIDKAIPTVTLSRQDSNPSGAASVNYSLQFSKIVTGLDATDLRLNSTGLVGVSIAQISGSGAQYSVQVSTGSGEGTLSIDLVDNDSIVDNAGNRLGGNGANNGTVIGPVYTIDRAPQVVSMNRVGNAISSAAQIQFQVTFDQAVFNVDNFDFVLVSTGISGPSIASVTGSGNSRLVTVNTGSGDGTLALRIPAGISIVDASGLALVIPGFDSQVVTIDKTQPRVSTITPLDATYTNAASVRFEVVFTENVSGVDGLDFQSFGDVLGSSITSLTGSGSTYIVTVNTGTGDGSLSLKLASSATITDDAGNSVNTLGGSGTGYTLDRTAPSVSSVTREQTSPTRLNSVSYVVQFSESVTGVLASDFQLTANSLPGSTLVVSTLDASSYRVTITHNGTQGTVGFDVLSANGIFDLANNPLPTAVTNNPEYVIDQNVPSIVNVTRLDANPTRAAVVTYQVVLSEPVIGVDTSDFGTFAPTLTGTTVQSVSGSGSTYNVSLGTGTGSGNMGITFVIGGVTDLAGNPWLTSSSVPFYLLDRQPPLVAGFASSSITPTTSTQIDYQLNFSESVTGVTVDDFQVVVTGNTTGAFVESVTGSFFNYVIRVNTGTGDGTVNLRLVDNDSIVDSVGNALGGSGIGNGTVDSSTPIAIQRNSVLGGTVWSDTNLDGVRNGGESVLTGVTVYLDLNDNGQLDSPAEPSTTSSTTGEYRFTDLAAGNYTVRIVKPDAVQQTFPAEGGPGRLTFRSISPSTFDPALVEASAVAMNASGTIAYVAGRWSSNINVYAIDQTTGAMSQLQSLKLNADGGQELRSIVRMLVSPNGNQLVTLTSGGLIAVYAISAAGRLTLTQVVADAGNQNASALAISADGNRLYVGGTSLTTYIRELTTGTLSFATQSSGFNFVQDIVVSPDGTSLYMVSNPGRIHGFTRNINSGLVTPQQLLEDGVGGNNNLLGARSIAISNDGLTVYVGAESDNSITVYSRAAGGLLTLVQTITDGVSGFDNLQGVGGLRVSPDNQRLYVTSSSDQVLTTFQRNLTSGLLSLHEQLPGSTTNPPITLPSPLQVAAAGKFVLVSSSNDNWASNFEVGVGFPRPLLVKLSLPAASSRLDLNFGLFDAAPVVATLKNLGGNPTQSNAVQFQLEFTEPVSGVDVSDFALQASGLTGATIDAVAGNGSLYTISVTTGSGSGSLQLRLNDDDTIVDAGGRPLGGTGPTIAIAETVLIVDRISPVVASSTPLDAIQTRLANVRYKVSFSEPVTGVDTTDFRLTNGGSISGANIVGVTGGPTEYVVTIATGTGNGPIRLDLVDNDSIVDLAGNLLGGIGNLNGSFASPVSYLSELSPASSIHGIKWHDLNENGIRELDEPGLPGWTIFIDANLNGALDLGELSTVTGGDGSYSFNNLFSGRYVLGEVSQTGWEATYPTLDSYPIRRLTGSAQDGFGGITTTRLSGNGRYVVFDSTHPTLGSNTNSDIYLLDLDTNDYQRISRSTSGGLPDGASSNPSISNDGRFIAFESSATNLVSGDANGLKDIFLFDRQTGTTRRINLTSEALAASGGASSVARISGDGRYVAYQSDATNLVPGDTNATTDIFLFEVATGVTSLISKNSAFLPVNSASSQPSISDDGSVIAFSSIATNLIAFDTNSARDVFVHNRITGRTQRVSQTPTTQGNADSSAPAVSGNGRYVAFWTNAANLLAEGSVFPRTMLYDLNTDLLESIGRNANTLPVAFTTTPPDISYDGRIVAFGTISSATTPSNVTDIVVRDRQTNITRRLTKGTSGVASGGDSLLASISDDGQRVLVGSVAKHLVPADANYAMDAFLIDNRFGWWRGSLPVEVGVSDAAIGNNFGNVQLDGDLSGTAWQDFDRDGLFDPGEPVIAGRQIYLDLNNDNQFTPGEPSTTTNAQGFYSFGNLTAGSYAVREVLPTGWAEFRPQGSYQQTIGQTRNVNFDFQDLAIASTGSRLIGDYVRDNFVFSTSVAGSSQFRVYGTSVTPARPSVDLEVANATNVQYVQRLDGRPFSGVSFNVRNTGNTNPLTLTMVGERVNGTTITTFASIDATPQTISLVDFTNVTSLRWYTSQTATISFDNVSLKTLDWNVANLNFASMPRQGFVSGTIYYDLDKDGARDPNEPGLGGRTVFLDLNNDGVYSPNEPSTVSSSGGVYRFASGIEAGTYRLRQRQLAGWTESQPGDGYTVTVLPDVTLTTLDFGNWGSAGSIRGTKFQDANFNGQRDLTEPGLAGWTIYLDLNNNSTLDTGEPSTVTAADDPFTASINEAGSYLFIDLAPVNYIVREVPQSGWVQTTPVSMQTSLSLNHAYSFTYSGFVHYPNLDQALSTDGRFLAFSTNTALLGIDINQSFDIYVLDRQTGQLELVSVSDSEQLGNGSSFEPTISDDGRFVAFRSLANNFYADTLTFEDIFVRDRQLGTTQLVNSAATGAANGLSREAVISGNGRQVLFWSFANNLVANDTNNMADLFLRDLDSNTLVRVNPRVSIINLSDESTFGGDMSADGRYIAYQSFSDDIVAGDTNGTSDIFVLDRVTNQLERVSTSSAGGQANGTSEKRSISDDGRFVVFDSTATNLTDEPGVNGYNIFLKDRVTGETRLISKSINGTAANSSRRPEISADGRFVVFETSSQTMFADSANTFVDLVLYDRLTDTLERLTKNASNGGPTNGASINASISRDGRAISFFSAATNQSIPGAGLFTISLTPNLNAPLAIRVELLASQTVGNLDFGNYQRVTTLAGIHFDDQNGSGLQDNNEPVLPGVTVYIDSNNNERLDAGEPTSTTASDGAYNFGNLLPGTLTVRAVKPSERTQTAPASPVNRLFGAYLVRDATSSTSFRLGIAELNPSNGTELRRFNTQIIADTRIGLAYDGEVLIVLNGASGSIYEILPSGQIVDSINVPSSNYLHGLAYVGGLAYFIEFSTVNWPQLVALDLQTNQVIRRLPLTHLVDGYGLNVAFPTFGWALGESADGKSLVVGAADVTAPDRRMVTIDPLTARVLKSETWDTSLPNDVGLTSLGGETFVSTTSSNTLRVFGPTGAPLRSFNTTEAYHGLAGASTSNTASVVNVTPGLPAIQINFGWRSVRGSIQGKLFDDRNGDSIQQPGEPSRPGATVYLDLNQNRKLDLSEPQAITDVTGSYVLAGVLPGDYQVRVQDPAGVQTVANRNELRLFGSRYLVGTGDVIAELDPVTMQEKNILSVPGSGSTFTGSGLAFDGQFVYFAKPGSNQLFSLSPDSGSIVRSVTMASSNIDGLASVAGILYGLDVTTDTIHQIDPLTGVYVRSMDLNALNPNYLAGAPSIDFAFGLSESADGTQLVASSTANLLFVIAPATGLIVESTSLQFLGGAGAAGERIRAAGTTTFNTFNSKHQLIRNSVGSAAHAGLGMSLAAEPARKVRINRAEQLSAIDFALVDTSTPADLQLSSSNIVENQASGAVVGSLSAIDANVLDTHQYALVAGAGDTDNASFQIVGNQLQSAATFNAGARTQYSVRIRITDSVGHVLEKPVAINVVNVPQLSAPVRIGDGTNQRSTIDQLVVSFDGLVDIADGAFVLEKRSRNSQGDLVLLPVDTNWLIDNTSGRSVVTLAFSGSQTRAGTGDLSDGNYQLRIVSSQIRTAATTVAFDGNGDGLAGGDLVLGAAAADQFYSLFADTNGDRTVGITEFAEFRNTFGKSSGSPGYDERFDIDGNNAVGINDFGAFRSRFGTSLGF